MSVPESLSLIKAGVTIIAALSAIYIGFAGLKSWKKQLKGKAEYELSRRILKEIYAYRDAIKNLRLGVILPYEVPSPPVEERDEMSSEQQHHYGLVMAYKERWMKITKARDRLYPDELEAEALWGDKLKLRFKALFDLEHELLISVRHHLQLCNPDTRDHTIEAIEKAEAKRRDILYDMSDEMHNRTDDFQTDIDGEISKIADFLKSRLKS